MQEELIKRLRERQMVMQFCTYADIAPNTLYKFCRGQKLKGKTELRLRSKWKEFQVEIAEII